MCVLETVSTVHPHYADKTLPFRLFCLIPILPNTHFAYYPFRLLTILPIHHFAYCLILCLHLTFFGNCQLFQDLLSAFKGILWISNFWRYSFFASVLKLFLQCMWWEHNYCQALHLERLALWICSAISQGPSLMNSFQFRLQPCSHAPRLKF
jgi:hypothetical protein